MTAATNATHHTSSVVEGDVRETFFEEALVGEDFLLAVVGFDLGAVSSWLSIPR